MNFFCIPECVQHVYGVGFIKIQNIQFLVLKKNLSYLKKKFIYG